MCNIELSAIFHLQKQNYRLLNQTKIIRLNIGEPDVDTADHIKLAAYDAIRQGLTHYPPIYGVRELREAIQRKLARENNLSYEIDNIIVGCGTKSIIHNLFMATIDNDDEVIVPTPCWGAYKDIISLFQGVVVTTPTTYVNQFKINLEHLANCITHKTKWLLLNSPNNPTGACYSNSELRDIADVMLQFPHVNILVDDIYEHIIFDGKKFNNILEIAPELRTRTFIVNGMSKAYAMTGWRVGYGVGNKEIIDIIAILQSRSTTNTSTISQHASIAALDLTTAELMLDNIKIYENKRDLAFKLLMQIDGMQCSMPDGAFYLFPSIEAFIGKHTKDGTLINSDSDFAAYLLEDYGVAITPGIAFLCSGHIRIAFAASLPDIQEGLTKLKMACENLK